MHIQGKVPGFRGKQCAAVHMTGNSPNNVLSQSATEYGLGSIMLSFTRINLKFEVKLE